MSQKWIILSALTFFLGLHNGAAREIYTVSGYITDAESGISLTDVKVYSDDSLKGVLTNKFGYYTLSLLEGAHTVRFLLEGYKEISKQVLLSSGDVKLDIHMLSSRVTLPEKVIEGRKKNENITSTEMSVEKFKIEQIETIPVIMGEKDIMKTIQLTPGITTITEGEIGFIVRGSGIDENLVLMDGMPLYYSSHMQGLYSVFNSDAVEGLVIYKGGMPAEYGGRAASVLDVSMKGDNVQALRAKLAVGLITGKFALETPIVPDRLTISGAGRFSKLSFGYLSDRINTDDGSNEPAGKSLKGGGGRDPDHNYFFNPSENWLDLNGKFVYSANDNHKLRLSGYFGRDSAITAGGLTEWGNRASTLRWSWDMGDRLLSNTSATYSRYFTAADGGVYQFHSGITTAGGKQIFTFSPNKSNDVRFGLSGEYQDYDHGSLEDVTQDDGGKFMPGMQSMESALFIGNDQRLTSKLGVYYGLRWSFFHQLGPGTVFVYDETTNEPLSGRWHGSRTDVMYFYQNPEPRFSLSYAMNKRHSIKFFYNRSAQYLRLMTMGMQLQWYDIWLPCTRNVEPHLVDQFAAGYFRNFFNDRVRFSAETYYKMSDGSADFEDGLHNYLVDNLEAYVATGEGRAYGLELMLKKPSGRLNGWFSYNLGRSERRIREINKYRWYPTIFDKTHDATAVLCFNVQENLSVSGTFLYQTGNAVTLPEAYYYISDVAFPYWEGRNKYRMPPYHRMDLGVRYMPEVFSGFLQRFGSNQKLIFELSVYNLYNRRNINVIGFAKQGQKSGGKAGDVPTPGYSLFEAYGTSIYGRIPSFELGVEFRKEF